MKWYSKIFVFLSGLFILLETLVIPLFPNFNNFKKYGYFNNSMYDLLGEEDNTIDAVFLGDSLIYASISPMLLWEKYGFTTYDCSISTQTMKETYDYLKIAIEKQHPKIAMFEADMLFRNPNSKGRKIKDFKKIRHFLPMYVIHNNWKKLLGGSDAWINYNKGYRYITTIDSVKSKNYMKENPKEKRTIQKENIKYLKKIIKLCESENIKLVIIANPSQKNWTYKKNKMINEIADKYNLEFIDLNLIDLGIDWENDTKDKGIHLNIHGAVKVTNFIGEYLNNTNLMINHKNDSKYSKWDRAYELYKKYNVESNKEKALKK